MTTQAFYHPRLYFGGAFNRDPNDPAVAPVWTDITNMVTRVGEISRGAQYELDQSLAAQPQVTFFDPGELLNAANASSALYPNVQPYRELVMLAQWPNTVGYAHVNLLNSEMWHGNKIDDTDPSLESYANGATIPNWLTAVGSVVATITTTNPQQGTKSATYAVAGTAVVQGLSWTAWCLPGTQYTSSVYVRQSSASTQRIEVVGVANGTTTTTTGAYVRLTVTFTATQPTHTVRLVTNGTAVAGQVNIDALQHEEGAAATTWETQGPVIYPVMRPFAERWPRRWEAAGFEGWADVPSVDALAALAAIDLAPEYVDALTATAPDYWWPLNGGAETGQWLDRSGNQRPPLVRNISKYGAGTDVEPDAPIPIVGDPGAGGAGFTATGSAVNWDQVGTSLAAGIGTGSLAQIKLPEDPSADWSMTAAAWYAATSNGEIQQIFGAFRRASVVARQWYSPFDLTISSGGAGFGFHNGTVNSGAPGGGTPNYADGQPHLLVGTVTQDATNTTFKVYYDGALTGSSTVTTASLGGRLASPASMVMAGGLFDGSNSGRMLSGVVAHAAIWNRVLSATEVTSLWDAGGLGYAGETPGARTVRDLARGGFTGTSRISTSSATTMQPPSWTGSIDLLTDSQNNAVAEQGHLWVAPDGAVVMESRADRFLRLTPLYTLGENEAGGELPYLEGVKLDYDPFFVFANVTVGRPGGSTATGGLAADITTARKRYFPRAFSAEPDVQTDAMAQDLADWIFNTHKAPLLRVAEVTFDPASNPSLWPFCLSVEVGNRVRLVRRAKAANAGAGLTMSADYFVENVKVNQIDRITGAWTYSLLLSPIGTGPGVTMQPWILDDTTLSVLGTSTVLGF